MLSILVISLLAPCPLKWDAQPDADGFRIWRGIELLADVKENRATIQLPTDSISTLTVTAYNSEGESEHSDPFPVLPVTPHSSQDLIEWINHKTFFVEWKSSMFFRFTYPLEK